MAAAPMSVDEREAKEAEEFRTGPLSVLTTSVKTNSQVCRGVLQPCAHDVSLLAASRGVCCSTRHQQQQQRQQQQRAQHSLHMRLQQLCGTALCRPVIRRIAQHASARKESVMRAVALFLRQTIVSPRHCQVECRC